MTVASEFSHTEVSMDGAERRPGETAGEAIVVWEDTGKRATEAAGRNNGRRCPKHARTVFLPDLDSNAVISHLDQSDLLLLRDVGVNVNSLIGIWGCHGRFDFYSVAFTRKPVLEWSASAPTKK